MRCDSRKLARSFAREMEGAHAAISVKFGEKSFRSDEHKIALAGFALDNPTGIPRIDKAQSARARSRGQSRRSSGALKRCIDAALTPTALTPKI